MTTTTTATASTASRFISSIKMNRPPLTDDEIERLRADVPDGPVALQEGWRACVACGVATPEAGNPTIEVVSRGRLLAEDDPASGVAMRSAAATRPMTTRMTECPACVDRDALAVLLAAQVHGHGSLALERARMALDVLALVDPSPERLRQQLERHDPSRLVAALWMAGVGLRLRTRFEPMLTPDTDVRKCSPYAWSHVMPGSRLKARKAITDLGRLTAMESTSDSPTEVPIACPGAAEATDGYPTLRTLVLGDDGATTTGCIVCGVTAVTVPHGQVQAQGLRAITSAVWRRVSVSPTGLGGTGPGKVLGFCCPTCAAAQEVNHAWGAATVVRALLQHLVADLAPAGRPVIDQVQVDVQGFGAEVAAARRANRSEPIATATPFGWLPDRDDLVTDLRRLLGRG